MIEQKFNCDYCKILRMTFVVISSSTELLQFNTDTVLFSLELHSNGNDFFSIYGNII